MMIKFTQQSKLTRAILIFELMMIIILSIGIAKKYLQSKTISFSALNKKDLIFSENSTLRYFYEPKPNSKTEVNLDWLTYKPSYTYNSDSLNERFEYQIQKPEGVFRIITLGDSFTFGMYMNTGDNYPEQLEDILNERLSCGKIKKFEVINLGVPGYDIEYAVERYKRRGQKYQSDLVLWLLRDLEGARINEIRLPKLEKYIKDNSINTASQSYYFNSKGEPYPVNKKMYEEIISEYDLDAIVDYQFNALKSLDNYYQGKLVLLDFKNGKNEKITRKFAKTREGTYYFNSLILSEALSDGHPTVKAYAEIAESIFRYLNNIVKICK